MKGFKNVFAAGAISIVLAVTGCQQYAPTDTADQATRANRRVATESYGSRNVARNTRNALTNNLRNTNARNNYRGQVSTGTANRYNSSAVTTNRSRNLSRGNTGGSGLVNTNIYGQRAVRTRVNPAPHSQQYSAANNLRTGTTGLNRSRNTGTGVSTRLHNTTGSPFGDYNKDRAYSGTRIGSTAGGSGLTAGAVQTNNAASLGNANVGNTVVRKNLTQGTEHTRSAAGTKVSNKKASNKASGEHAATKSAAKKTTTKKAGTKTTTAKAVHNTKTTNTNTTKNKNVNTAASTAANKTAGTTKSNTAHTKTGANASTSAAVQHNIASNRNNTQGVNQAQGSTGTGAVNRSSANISNNVRAGAAGVLSRDISKAKFAGNYQGSIANSINFNGTAYNNKNTAVNTRGRSSANSTSLSANNANTNNNMNNSFGRYSRNRGVNDLVYNNTIYNNDMLYNYDNMTIGNTYRNANLRNDYYNYDNYYGYNGVNGINNTPNSRYTGINNTQGLTSTGINQGANVGSNRTYGTNLTENTGNSYGMGGVGYNNSTAGTRGYTGGVNATGSGSMSYGSQGIR